MQKEFKISENQGRKVIEAMSEAGTGWSNYGVVRQKGIVTAITLARGPDRITVMPLDGRLVLSGPHTESYINTGERHFMHAESWQRFLAWCVGGV